MKAVLKLLLLLLIPTTGFAVVERMAMLEESNWELTSSIYECRLQHEIPSYGTAELVQGAGEDVYFQMLAVEPAKKTLKNAVQVKFQTPMWLKPKRIAKEKYQVDLLRGRKIIRLDAEKSKYLVTHLEQGLFPSFYLPNKQDVIRVSAVNFGHGYEKFKSCVKQLVPYDYRDVQVTSVYFETGQSHIDQNNIQDLEKLSAYLEADRKIRQVIVEGYTDSIGRISYNRELSHRRMLAVTEFLMDKGISRARIKTKSFGEKNPNQSNVTAEGRASNRRVVIRLIK